MDNKAICSGSMNFAKTMDTMVLCLPIAWLTHAINLLQVFPACFALWILIQYLTLAPGRATLHNITLYYATHE